MDAGAPSSNGHLTVRRRDEPRVELPSLAGVQVAVSAAVALRPPALAFPVRDLESCRAMTQR